MSKKMYVGNLAFQSTEDDIQNLFSQYGEVKSVNLITDRDTGRSRGFAFVEMDDGAADQAMQNLDGTDFDGRNLKINEARPRT
jgi:RNA recognition motif-containing protein